MESFADVHINSATQPAVLPAPRALRHIGIVLLDGFALLEAAESTRHGAAHYDVCLLSESGGGIASSSSVFVRTESVEARRHFHGLFILGGEGAHSALRGERLLTWLRCAYPNSELVSAIGEGRLMLESIGLRQATSSRRYGESIREIMRNSPAAGFATDFVSPQRTAWMLVQADLGAEIARQIAHWVAPPVEAHFATIVPKSASGCVSEKIQASARWLQANGDRPITIDQVAQVAAMSERNFLRRFKLEIGVTPSDYLLYVRLDMSCRLLAKTNLPVDKVARRCGIGSGGGLAKLFRKHLATTPTEYRESKRASTISW
jgi:transcriptional regulator GlxA family with amidase domain